MNVVSPHVNTVADIPVHVPNTVMTRKNHKKMQVHSRKCLKFYYNYSIYSSYNVVTKIYVFWNKYYSGFHVFPQEKQHLPLCLHVATAFGAPTQDGRQVCIHRLMSGNGVGQSRLSISMDQ